MTVKELRTLVDNLDEYIRVPGGIERLKKTILHLAVSGQLVPQDPYEGTGEELYQQIQAEKQKLIKEGKLKKQKLLKEISEEGIPFAIPITWKWTRLADVTIFSIGRTPARKESTYWDEPYMPWVSIADLKAGEHISRTKEKISKKAFEKCFGENPVPAGSLLYSFKLTIGKMSIIDTDAVHNEAIASFVTYAPELTEYLFKALNVVDPIGKTNQAIMGKTLNSGSLSLVEVPLPPLKEQKRIVEKVDAIFALIDDLVQKYTSEQLEREKLVASSLAQLSHGQSDVTFEHLSEIIRTKADAAELRKTILHLAVSGQLVPQDPSEGTGEALYQQIQAEKIKLIKAGKLKPQKELPPIKESEVPFEIPKSWKMLRLGSLCWLEQGEKGKGEKLYNLDAKYLRGKKDPDIKQTGFIVSSGERMILVDGENSGEVFISPERGYLGSTFKKLGVAPNLNIGYLDVILWGLKEEMRQNKVGSAIPHLDKKLFREKIVGLPPLAEQARIVKKTTKLLDLVTQLEQQLEK